ncbi:hypothetical protein [Aeoliella mucimassa]|uniref:Uncharacterized protein n=1 Tax=Aeoliella mucimassa TaxID=2527972 RepID=A0A518AID9_9BACT|nr:hypothetical protein [Aeoliella mucimassa]QDU54505.1 hypothetical protein Pan181_06870 [Aeoliella mucimassa]
MSEFLYRYEKPDPTTWAYLSALLIIALFFKFNRLFSIRNLDLLLLLMLAPGLLCLRPGLDSVSTSTELFGYWWLFGVNALLLVRALWDSAMVRRPMLEPNMNAAGLLFLAVSMSAFLMANIINGAPDESDMFSAQRAEHLSHREASRVEGASLDTHGPGCALVFWLPSITTSGVLGDEGSQPVVVEPKPAEANGTAKENATNAPATDAPEDAGFTNAQEVTAKVVTILCQAAIVLGMILIGVRHFENFTMGCAAATLYLLLPYTAIWTGNGTHVIPTAFMVWAVVCYRLPILSGLMLGLAFGTLYYPVFLLPLWISFYRQRGVWRFLIGFAVALLAMIITQIATSVDFPMFVERMQQMFGVRLPKMENLSGAWQYWNPVFRWPVLATFLGMSVLSMPFWPSPKTLASLLSCSAAVMLGVQFWHAHSGGLALAWYLPFLLLMLFRPNLEDRVAVNVVH